jgi:hypothetical protein
MKNLIPCDKSTIAALADRLKRANDPPPGHQLMCKGYANLQMMCAGFILGVESLDENSCG